MALLRWSVYIATFPDLHRQLPHAGNWFEGSDGDWYPGQIDETTGAILVSSSGSAGGSSTVLKSTQVTVTTAAALIVTPALTPRTSIVIHPIGAKTIYISETALKATPALGYAVKQNDALTLDVAAGVSIFASTATSTCDVRILETGS